MSCIASSLVLLTAYLAASSHTTAVPPAGREEGPRSSRVRIALDLDVRLPQTIQRLAVEEAARVWAPYRVDVTLRRATPLESPAPEGAVLSVRLADPTERTTALSSPFGSIRFVNGLPEPLVFLHYDAISRAIVGFDALGVGEGQWPPALRDRVLGRIAGRVLAHEIGHFVLRSPRHASRGLMRSIQYISELIAGNGELFGLTSEDLSLLRAAMSLRTVDAGNAGG